MRKVHSSEFQVSASNQSPGIQVADLILWLFKKFLDGKEIPYESANLLAFAMRRGMQSDFSFEGVEQAMLENFGHTLEADLSPEDLEKARDLQERYEQIRLDNIASYDRDGLMPFERQARDARIGESK